MTAQEAIDVLFNEWKCIDRNDGIHCDRKCETCDLVMDVGIIREAYNMAIAALEAQEIRDLLIVSPLLDKKKKKRKREKISALEAQEWIPVDKKSHPDTPIRVQVQLDNGWIITAYYEENEWLSVPDCGEPIQDRWIEAWKPLPQPYKEESEKV